MLQNQLLQASIQQLNETVGEWQAYSDQVFDVMLSVLCSINKQLCFAVSKYYFSFRSLQSEYFFIQFQFADNFTSVSAFSSELLSCLNVCDQL